MRRRRPNHRLVKIHRNYTVEEAARMFGIHKNTVRCWIKAGLPVCDDMRPQLILGRELAALINSNRLRMYREFLDDLVLLKPGLSEFRRRFTTASFRRCRYV